MISLLLIILTVISSTIGLIILLVLTDIIALKNNSGIKVLYSALVITLLLLVFVLATKFISESDGDWLPSFKSSDSCNKKDPPFWCDLDTGDR